MGQPCRCANQTITAAAMMKNTMTATIVPIFTFVVRRCTSISGIPELCLSMDMVGKTPVPPWQARRLHRPSKPGDGHENM